jgi:SulP family sulfate permease
MISAAASTFARLGLTNENFKHDVIAGITVSLVAIPQSLAYAQLAGVPAYYGLYAAFIPTIVGALVGSSRQLSTGPVALTSLLTAASVAPLAAHGSDLYSAYVILLALLSGVLQIVFGLLRAGILLNFLSHPVLMGFINAAALIIGLSQLPAMLGIPSGQSPHFLTDMWHVVSHIDTTHQISAVFGVSGIVLLVLFRRYAPRFPGVLITVALATCISAAIGYAAMGGRVVGEIPSGLPSLSLPPLTLGASMAQLPASFVIAIISFMEAVSSAKLIAIRTREPWSENRELIGQGLAKVAAAFCHSMPVSGSFSRSALNLSASARTSLSSVISALCVLMALLFFTSLLYHLPKPVLSAIILMAVIGLVDFSAIRNAWKASRDDGTAAVVTFVATLAFAPNIQNGIVTGMLLSLGLLLFRMTRPRVASLVLHTDGTLVEANGDAEGLLPPRLCAVRFDGGLRFVNVSYFEDALLDQERRHPNVACILIKSSGINGLDASGVEVLRNLVRRFRANGIALAFSGLKPQVHQVMDRAGLTDEIGAGNIFVGDREAIRELVARFDARQERREA